MTQECILTGRITRLAFFRVPELGSRAGFQLGRLSTRTCRAAPRNLCGIR